MSRHGLVPAASAASPVTFVERLKSVTPFNPSVTAALPESIVTVYSPSPSTMSP